MSNEHMAIVDLCWQRIKSHLILKRPSIVAVERKQPHVTINRE